MSVVEDDDEAVGIGARFAVAADGGGDGPDGDGAVAVRPWPVMLRRPSVAGAQGRPVAVLLPVG